MATLLLADVEGSTRLWKTQPDEMTALARFNETVSEISAAHDGVRPVEQGEGDSFVGWVTRITAPRIRPAPMGSEGQRSAHAGRSGKQTASLGQHGPYVTAPDSFEN